MDQIDPEQALKKLIIQLLKWESEEQQPKWIAVTHLSLMVGPRGTTRNIDTWLEMKNVDLGGLTSRELVLKALEEATWEKTGTGVDSECYWIIPQDLLESAQKIVKDPQEVKN